MHLLVVLLTCPFPPTVTNVTLSIFENIKVLMIFYDMKCYTVYSNLIFFKLLTFCNGNNSYSQNQGNVVQDQVLFLILINYVAQNWNRTRKKAKTLKPFRKSFMT